MFKLFDEDDLKFDIKESDFLNIVTIKSNTEKESHMKFIVDKEILTNSDGKKVRRVYDDDNEHIGDYMVDDNSIIFKDLSLQEEVVEEAVEDAAEYGLKRFGLSAFISATQVSKFVTKYVFKGFAIVFNIIKGFIAK